MARDRVVKRLISSEALFHRFADLFRGFFLVSFACLSVIGFLGTGYFALKVVTADIPKVPDLVTPKTFSPPTVEEFRQFADRILDGTILWPTFSQPDIELKVQRGLSMKDSRAIESGAALLESLIAARGVQEDDFRREKAIRLITHTHHRLSSLSGAPDISFARLFFDHLMQASLAPAYFPNNQSIAGQKRERVNRFLVEYPLIHVEWFSKEVQDRIEGLVKSSDRYAAHQAELHLSVALADQSMQRDAILSLVCLVMFALSALLFLLIRIERNQTLQTQFMANRYVMYMPTPQSDP